MAQPMPAVMEAPGTVFTIAPDLNGVFSNNSPFTVLHSFSAWSEQFARPHSINTDGADPFASLIQASDGNLYGTTYYGGAYGVGTVFKITQMPRYLLSNSPLTTLHSFDGNGANPWAGLIQASNGNLYGTTYYGGLHNQGTVFTITLSGTFTVVYSFGSSIGDGGYPYAGLVQASDGNLYGATGGTVFRVNLPNNTQVPIAYAYLSQFGGSQLFSGQSLQWSRSTCAIDENGNIFAIASTNYRVEKFDNNAQLPHSVRKQRP